MNKILIILGLLISSLVIGQTNYYISNSGDDSNNGLTTATPFKTLSKINNDITLAPGDSVLLKSGDVFRDHFIFSENGTLTNPIYIGTYGGSSNARIYGSQIASTWTATGTSNIWQCSTAYSNPRTTYPSELFFLKDDSTSWGWYKGYTSNYSNLTDDLNWTINGTTFYVYSTTDPDTRFDFVEVPQLNTLIEFPANDLTSYYEFKHLTLKYSRREGFRNGYPALQGGKGLHFRYDTIGYIGEKGGNASYGLSIWSSDVIIEDNFFSDCGRRAISYNLYLLQDYESRRIMENVVIRNNIFKRGQHTTSLDLASMGDYSVSLRPDTARNFYFYNNIVDDSNLPMTNGDETSNEIYIQPGGMTIENIWIMNNLFKYATARNINLTPTADSVRIYNNTIIGHNPNITVNPYSNITLNASRHNYIVNNIIYSNLPANSLQNHGVLIEHSPSEFVEYDYNLHWQEHISNSDRNIIGGIFGYYTTEEWSSYRASNPTFEEHSPTPAQPIFENYAEGNYRLSPLSIGTDDGIYLTKIITDYKGHTDTIGKYDLDGKPRSLTAPSIGAYEFGDIDSTLNDIKVFSIPNQITSTINAVNHTVAVTMPYGTDRSNLTPSMSLDFGATINPTSGTARDFTSNVNYTTTALKGNTQVWVITVTNVAPSTDNDILTFTILNQATNTVIDLTTHTVYIEMPPLTDRSNLIPNISASTGAVIVPISGASQDFTNDVVYNVTAENGAVQAWTITVITQIYDPEYLLDKYGVFLKDGNDNFLIN